MIQIRRPTAEPADLTVARAAKLLVLTKKVVDKQPFADKDFEGYGAPAVKRALYEMQHHKCCYCEKSPEKEYEDVEHFRPKKKANRGPGSEEKGGYWWLALTWDNLFFCCQQCNKKKGTRFPLRYGSALLAPPSASTDSEQSSSIEWPLLLHPSREQGLLHIEFRREEYGVRVLWRPRCRDRSVRGAFTIWVLELDREGLLEAYERHVRDVEREIAPVREAIAKDDRRALWAAFHRARKNLFAPARHFIGLSYDAVRFFVPDSDLRRVDARLRWPVPDEIPVERESPASRSPA